MKYEKREIRDGKEEADSGCAALLDCLVHHLIAENISVSAMESCTSGLLASGLTDTEGASAVFKGAFVTYSKEAKVA
ncbi:MAG: CinA family protein, partial [Lachnospiraceae bacterium]|nr:CinA family protein [Lachnospiraceae bacterium]